MPLVRTLLEPIRGKTEKNPKQTISIEELAMRTAGEILADKPYYVMNSIKGKVDSEGLKKEIIRILDRDNLYFTVDRSKLIKGIFDFMFGYGVLQEYIDDEDISDIDGTAYNEFTVKKLGRRYRIDIDFGDEKSFLIYCRLIAVRSGGFLNEDDTHCRTADIDRKLRINVSIPPRNVSGPAISIRKHRDTSYTLENLRDLHMLDNESYDYIDLLAKTSKSIIFCGKGAAGKTTLMRALLNSLPELERVLVVESDAEIYPDKAFCIEQRIKRPGDGGKPVTLEMLIKDGLTMSLDTYCIGEITGSEAYSFIKASYTGHRVLGTIHSKGAAEAMDRLVSLASSGSSFESTKRLHDSALTGIDCIIYLSDFKVMEIAEINRAENQKPYFISIYRRSLD